MKATTMRTMRQYHRYLGVLFAPTILFFAFSGALQTWDFHEPKGGAKPPYWINVIATLHKKQTLPRAKSPRPAAPTASSAVKAPALPAAGYPFALKLFVGLMSIGLMLSTLIGLVIALTTPRARLANAILLATGVVLPIVLILR